MDKKQYSIKIDKQTIKLEVENPIFTGAQILALVDKKPDCDWEDGESLGWGEYLCQSWVLIRHRQRRVERVGAGDPVDLRDSDHYTTKGVWERKDEWGNTSRA